MKWFAKILKMVGITKVTDWVVAGGWKIFESKVIALILRKLEKSVMPRLKVKARQLGVKFSATLNKLEDRNQLPDGSAEKSEAYFFELLQAFEKGAKSDN